MSCYERLADGTLRTAIPCPFWERSWRTWFRWRPMCCDSIFASEELYRDHYVRCHVAETGKEGEN